MRPQAKTVLVIACGAIAREVHQIKLLNDWQHMELQAIDASLHFTPTLIAPAVREKLELAKGCYEKVYVAFADCGTYGELDRVLSEYSVERLPGLHCYATFAGQSAFEQHQQKHPGTFYLTDFLVQHFDRFVVSALKLDRHPELKQAFFANYTHVLYLSQSRNPLLLESARKIADYLGLEFGEQHTAYGELVPELNSFMSDARA